MFVKNVELKFLRIEKLEGQDKPDWGEHEYNIIYRAESLDELNNDSEKLERFNEELDNSERDITLEFEGEVFTEGNRAVISEYYIDKDNEFEDEEEKGGSIEILKFDTEEEINFIIEQLDKEFNYMDEQEQFDALYQSFKDEIYNLTSIEAVKRRIMVFKGTIELSDEEVKLAKEFFENMEEEIQHGKCES